VSCGKDEVFVQQVAKCAGGTRTVRRTRTPSGSGTAVATTHERKEVPHTAITVGMSIGISAVGVTIVIAGIWRVRFEKVGLGVAVVTGLRVTRDGRSGGV
jgi:hypothetical protein